jgi:hypothetical protein
MYKSHVLGGTNAQAAPGLVTIILNDVKRSREDTLKPWEILEQRRASRLVPSEMNKVGSFLTSNRHNGLAASAGL